VRSARLDAFVFICPGFNFEQTLSNLFRNSGLLANVRKRVGTLCPWLGRQPSGRRREGPAIYSGPSPLAAGTVGYGEDLG
jgi:hypothetical protein